MADNRLLLIQKAASLFMESGFHGTGLEDILTRSGVSRSNFYYHFKSKDDLAVAVADFWIRDYDTNLIAPSLDAPGPLSERLERLYRIASDTQGPTGGLRGCPLGQLANELAAAMPEVRSRLKAYFEGVRQKVLRVVASESKAPAETQESISFLVVAALEGGLLLSGLNGTGAPMQQAGRAVIALLGQSDAM